MQISAENKLEAGRCIWKRRQSRVIPVRDIRISSSKSALDKEGRKYRQRKRLGSSRVLESRGNSDTRRTEEVPIDDMANFRSSNRRRQWRLPMSIVQLLRHCRCSRFPTCYGNIEFVVHDEWTIIATNMYIPTFQGNPFSWFWCTTADGVLTILGKHYFRCQTLGIYADSDGNLNIDYAYRQMTLTTVLHLAINSNLCVFTMTQVRLAHDLRYDLFRCLPLNFKCLSETVNRDEYIKLSTYYVSALLSRV